MKSKANNYTNNSEFLEFLNREFDDTATHATVEELAEFAFGSLKASIEAYEKEKLKNEH